VSSAREAATLTALRHRQLGEFDCPSGPGNGWMKSFRPAGEAIFPPHEIILKPTPRTLWQRDARGDSAMKKKESFFTLVLSRWAIHLMAIAYAGCEIISRS
jgi:hypothetical protein